MMAERFPSKKRSSHGPRKIVAPELLETRNAPGVMLPIPAPFETLASDPQWDITQASPVNERADRSDIDAASSRRSGTNDSQRMDRSLELLVAEQTADDTYVQTGAQSRADRRVDLPQRYESQTFFAAFDVGGQLRAAVRPTVADSVATPSAVEPVAEQSQPKPRVEPTPPPASTSSSGGGGGAGSSVTGPGDTGGTVASAPAASNATTNTPVQTAAEVAEPVAEGSGGSGEGTVSFTAPFTILPPLQSTSAPTTNGQPTLGPATIGASTLTPAEAQRLITADDVLQLLQRAAGATSSNDAIIAIVDRGGRILGVRVEEDVPITDNDTLVFAIDGAVAKARTAAFFSNDQAALTSRTVRFISQTTITQREVQSNPNIADANSTVRGPGFVAPIGLGSHFPPDIPFTPQVDLVGIEHTNRDSVAHPGTDRLKQEATVDANGNVTGTMGDDFDLGDRFGAAFDSPEKTIVAPESYGLVSGRMTEAQSRGIGTLPGGIPLYKNGHLVGGIGVFFPGETGQSDFEQGFVHADVRAANGLPPQTTEERTNATRVIEAEYIALQVALNQQTVAGVAPLAGYGTTIGRIDLVGITLETVGPHRGGIELVQNAGRALGEGNPDSTNTGDETMPDQPVVPSGIVNLDGAEVADEWLVSPQAGGGLTADEVRDIIERGIAEAGLVRSAIRLPIGQRSRMVLSVTDTDGNVLGLYRMPDATVFSIDVAVAKARNVAYYADAADLQPEDMIDENNDNNPDVAPGVAFTNRTFRFLATAYYPSGIDGTGGGPFSILNDPNVNPATAENIDNTNPAAANAHTSVLGFDAFNPGSNFREPVTGASAPDPGLQNGVVFFPGSTPLYKDGTLVGGLGVSGDGVDQDDVVTFVAAGNMLPRSTGTIIRADQVFVRGVRLPFQKFLRNPHG